MPTECKKGTYFNVVMVFLIKVIGLVLSVLPYSFLEKLSNLLGVLLVTVPNKRKRIIFSNLKYAFPDWSSKKITLKGRESAARLIEMGLLSLSYPYFSAFRKRSILLIDQKSEASLADFRTSGKPVIFLIPHVCLFETLAISPNFRPFAGKSLGAIYRPNRNPKLDQLIINSRTSVGVEVFSRDSALWSARDFLKRGNWLGLLFDQHSGIQGCHSYFLNRFASITTMPELLGKASNARVVFCFPRRVGFFKAKLELEELTCAPADYPFKAHEILENTIRRSDGLPEWLWAHERWKTQQNYRFHLRHRHKREKFPNSEIRTTKLWIRMPNWLGDVVMTFPLIDAIKRGRPDAEITLVAKPQFKDLLIDRGICNKFISLPYGGSVRAYKDFFNKKYDYPSIIINFANSFRSDLECFSMGAPARYGLMLPDRKRPLLSHSFRVPSDYLTEDTKVHQTQMWEKMLNYFGLIEKPLFTPPNINIKRKDKQIGILPGSSNNPSKRWPVENWINLIIKILEFNTEYHFKLYGSGDERETGELIRKSFKIGKVENLCGKTTLLDLSKELSSCSTVIGNDSGGMHLANFLGVQTVVIFGPTNPDATRPIFGENSHIIKADFQAKKNKTMDVSSKIISLL